jgi:hypothetical protein
MAENTNLYAAWLRYVFDRPDGRPDWWLVNDDEPFGATDEEVATLIRCTFLRCGEDLGRYSDSQVSSGLGFILDNAFSDCVFILKNPSIPVGVRTDAVRAIGELYRACFSIRCAPVLSHRNQPGGTPLNSTCYMLWDVTPIHWWENDPEKEHFYPVIVRVMREALRSPNIACIESALHGLGHLVYYRGKEVQEVIDEFLAMDHDHPPELLQYAKAARTGMIN